MGLTTYNVSRAAFVVDINSTDIDQGYSINWGEVTQTDGNGNKYIDAGTIMSLKGGGIFPRKNAALTVDSATASSSTATYTTANDHGLQVGDYVTVENFSTSDYNVTRGEVTAVPSSTEFSIDIGTTPADDTGGGDAKSEAVGIMISTINNYDLHNPLNGVGLFVGGVFHENLLPDNGNSNFATFKSELNATGEHSFGTGYSFRQYSNTIGS